MPTLPSIFRWFLLLLAGALIWHYSWRLLGSSDEPRYRSITLVQGSKAIGRQLAGVAIDPNRRDVYAIVGNEKSKTLPSDFFVLWKRKDGEHYGLTFFQQGQGVKAFCQMDRNGQLESLRNLPHGPDIYSPAGISGEDAEETLRSIVQSLPPPFELSPRH